MGVRSGSRLWLWWTTTGVVATLAVLALPPELVARTVLYDAISVLSIVALLVGVRVNRPTNAAVWYVLAAGKVLWLAGDVTYSVYAYGLHQHPFPYLGDLFYLSAYPVTMVALFMLILARSAGRDLAGMLDAAIIGTGASTVMWVLLVNPTVANGDSSPLARFVALSYPGAALLMLLLLARLATTSGSRNPSLQLLFAAQLGVLFSDIAYSIATTTSFYSSGPAEVGWLLSYVLGAAAALHPSVRDLPDAMSERDTTFTLRRITIVAVFTLAPPGLLLLQGLTNPGHIAWLPISTGMALLSVLVLGRAAGLLAHISQQSERLVNLAMHDELTGLPNRRLFERTVAEALARGRRTQVALVDLDDFKAVNDRFGHIVGDRLLVEVGRRLRANLREADLVARLGGDEFATAVIDPVEPDRDRPWQRVLATLHEPVMIDDHRLFVHASLGLTDAAGTRDALEVMRRADIAMYAAKQAGGHRLRRYELDLDRQAIEQALLGEQLRQAIDRDELWLAYQPIVDLPVGRLVALEVLLRWNHPDLGPVVPDWFIPIAEHTGVIEELGAWVLDEACRQLAAWDARFGTGAPPRISVNVSARQLTLADLAGTVASTLARHNLAADRLTLEVTETAVFGGGGAVETLHALRALGAQIALDDFGTGSSSLGLLLQCPVQVLKVDKSFVDSIVLRTPHAVIAAALIEVSDRLGLAAVAEGVETAEQANTLFELGYRFAQGYYFGRPVDADSIATLLTDRPDLAELGHRPLASGDGR